MSRSFSVFFDESCDSELKSKVACRKKKQSTQFKDPKTFHRAEGKQSQAVIICGFSLKDIPH